MKNLIIAIAFIGTTLTSCAQNKKTSVASMTFATTDSSVKTQLSKMLNVYYDLKDALVAINEKLAASKAQEFEQALALVDMKKMTSQEHSYYMPLEEKLAYHVGHIKTAPNLDHMREHFGAFSDNLWAVTKAFKINTTTAYQQYCPMQKATWISKESSIKNPYYGSQMLTCGSVKETLK